MEREGVKREGGREGGEERKGRWSEVGRREWRERGREGVRRGTEGGCGGDRGRERWRGRGKRSEGGGMRECGKGGKIMKHHPIT